VAVVGAFFAIPLAFAPGDLPPATAASGIPARAIAAYRAAALSCPGIRWELLAAIGQVESGHGSFGGASR
jgi:hypothetical protein